MSNWTRDRLKALRGRPVYGRAAARLGTVTDVLSDATSSKAWIAIDTGRSSTVIVVALEEDAVKSGGIYLPLDPEALQALSGRRQGSGQLERFYGREDLP